MYGPVRTVVWQGSAGDRRPYADRRLLGAAIGRLHAQVLHEHLMRRGASDAGRVMMH